MAISFSSIICKQAFFRLKIDYSCGFNYDCVSKCNSDYDYFTIMSMIMIMTMVDIRKIMYCISMFATKPITKFLKKQV